MSESVSAYVKVSVAVVLFLGCASSRVEQGQDVSSLEESVTPVMAAAAVGGIMLGEPLAVTIDIAGNIVVADGVPGRLVRIDSSGEQSLEFQRPAQSPGFHPSDVKLSGFFVYALDEVGRVLQRFDTDGAYRDQLVNFDEVFDEGQVSPVGMDVDPSGRIAVTDVRNHRIILFNSFLDVELVFGNYGAFPGQFSAPEGVSFTEGGELLVADTGNRRIQRLNTYGSYLGSIPPERTTNPLRAPRRAVANRAGEVYVADPEAGRVFVFDGGGQLIRSIAPRGVDEFRPTDVAVAAAGLIYVTDTANNSLYVFR
ncbi:MAG: NHL repeat-containing protein [Candidatus Krumholzibacteriia bacterium]